MPARYILVSGDKGGTGKSTTAHLAAVGLSMLRPPVPACVVTTDPREFPLTDDGRRYVVLDGREPEQLAAILTGLAVLEDDPVVLIDGAAARHELDAALSALVRPLATVVPFMAARHEFDRARLTLDALPAAYGLPSAWGTRKEDARRREAWPLPASPDRLLAPVPRMAPLSELLSPGGADGLPYRATKLAKGLALALLAAAGIDHPGGGQAPPARR
jgi:hypothetical protein